ncbi:hypothetical protein D3C80_1010100 [compost metagenome]
MKSDPDQKKRADHAEQAGIKLRCADEARDGACLFRLGGRWGIGLGHIGHELPVLLTS